MADIEKTIKLGIDTGDSVRSVKDLKDQIEGLGEEVGKVGKGDNLKKFNDQLGDQKKALDKVEDSAKKTGGGISNMVGKIAAGVSVAGLLEKAFEVLSAAFMKNQKVADQVATIMKTIEIVLGEVVNVIVGVIEEVSKTTNGFDALGKVIGGLLTLSLTPLKLMFYEIKLAIQTLQLAWEESFFGDDDPETIKRLNEGINETKKNLIEVGEDAIQAGKDVVMNIVPAIISVGQVVEGSIDGISKINVKAAYAQAEANVALTNTALIAEANAKNLVEEYDRQAEKLRQIRDDESLAITDRIAANEKLGEVLDQEEKALLAQVGAKIASAQANYEVNKSKENEAALITAIGERSAVLAQIEGLRSEQKVNEISLNKELLELNTKKLESEAALSIEQKKFDAERITDAVAKAEALKQIAIQERDIELQRLDDARVLYKEGTTARLEADIEYNTAKIELNNAIIKSEDDITKAKADAAAKQKDVEDKAAAKAADDAKKLKDARTKAAWDTANNIVSIVAAFGEKNKKAAKAAFNLQKGIDAAQAGIATYKAANQSYAALSGIPVVGPALGAIAAGAAIAAGIINVRKILSAKFDSPPDTGGGAPPTTDTTAAAASGGSAVEGGNQAPAPGLPTFNLTGQTIGGASNMLGNQTGGGGQAPVKVYVSETDISSVQGKVNVIQGNSLFGG
jgi:hypothetical protein